MYAVKPIKICAEYRDMLPRHRLALSGTPGLRPIGLSPGSWQTSLGLGSMSRYTAQIIICTSFPQQSHFLTIIITNFPDTFQYKSVEIIIMIVVWYHDRLFITMVIPGMRLIIYWNSHTCYYKQSLTFLYLLQAHLCTMALLEQLESTSGISMRNVNLISEMFFTGEHVFQWKAVMCHFLLVTSRYTYTCRVKVQCYWHILKLPHFPVPYISSYLSYNALDINYYYSRR